MKLLRRWIAAIKRFYSPVICECGGLMEEIGTSGYLQCTGCGEIR